nr:restriction endonuclease [Lacticaseibacillus thailandensis]
MQKKAKFQADGTTVVEANDDDNEDPEDSWKAELLVRIKQFSPAKFEQFARLLIHQMGVRIDAKMGKVISGDHGIDGFGYFQSDEFRTSRVAIQAKRYGDGPVGEPEIDKFKGVMDSFNAEYGIFITTSHFTDGAKRKAVQGAKSVTLIDGQGIVQLVEKYQLHISPVQTFELDDYYTEKN